MFAWVLRLVILFALLTAIYVVLSAFLRWGRKRKLQAEYRARPPIRVREEVYVARGLSSYDRSLGKKLLLGVYLLPVGIVGLLVMVALYA